MIVLGCLGKFGALFVTIPDPVVGGMFMIMFGKSLTLRPPNTTIVLYANNLDPDETASSSPSHPDPGCLTLRQQFLQLWMTLKHFEPIIAHN